MEPKPDPASRIAQGDILLLSSTYEGVPAVVLEALAVGVPVIATRCSAAMSALLEEGRLGYLVPVADVRALAEAIATAGQRTQDSATSLEQARRFTLEAASGTYLASFAAVARRAGDDEKIRPRRLWRSIRRVVSPSSPSRRA